MRRTPRAIAALALLGLAIAGCASDTADDGATTTGDTRTEAVRFAECMRANGVAEFPDPDASGELTIDAVLNGTSLDADSSEWKEATKACKKLRPAGFTGRKRDASQQDGALAFAQCMRDNGVRDFPDPTPDSPLVDTNRIPSAATEAGMSAIDAAMRACGDAAANAGVTAP